MTAAILAVGTLWAPMILLFGDGLFVYIQDMAVYFAPPIAVVFLAGILWRGATARAANITLIVGVVLGIVLKVAGETTTGTLSDMISPFLNRAFINWVLCLMLLVVVSLLTRRAVGDTSTSQRIAEITWTPSTARLPEEERKRYTGLKSFWLWWAAVLVLRVVVYVIFA